MTSTSTTDTLLSTAQLAAELGVTPGTLRNWRTAGRGPRGARIGGRVRYRRADVDTWITQQTERDPLVERRERVSERQMGTAARR